MPPIQIFSLDKRTEYCNLLAGKYKHLLYIIGERNIAIKFQKRREQFARELKITVEDWIRMLVLLKDAIYALIRRNVQNVRTRYLTLLGVIAGAYYADHLQYQVFRRAHLEYKWPKKNEQPHPRTIQNQMKMNKPKQTKQPMMNQTKPQMKHRMIPINRFIWFFWFVWWLSTKKQKRTNDNDDDDNGINDDQLTRTSDITFEQACADTDAEAPPTGTHESIECKQTSQQPKITIANNENVATNNRHTNRRKTLH